MIVAGVPMLYVFLTYLILVVPMGMLAGRFLSNSSE